VGRYAYRGTTSAYLRLSIIVLQREGFLRPSGWATLTWSRNGEVIASLGLRAEFDRITLRYRHQGHGEEWSSKEYPVFLDETVCHYGGNRHWFLCPAQGCSRRVGVIYGGSIFACRHCHKLAYESQREAAYSRALTRAQAIREKLGGSVNMAEPFPSRPKGMHYRTYWRLCRRYQEAQNRSWPHWLLKAAAVRL
jgi:hypothetical protein